MPSTSGPTIAHRGKRRAEVDRTVDWATLNPRPIARPNYCGHCGIALPQAARDHCPNCGRALNHAHAAPGLRSLVATSTGANP